MGDNDRVYLEENWFVYIQHLANFYKILNREPLEYETGRETTTIFTAIASGANVTSKSIEILEPDASPLHLFQVIPGFKHIYMRYYMKIPTGTSRLGTDDEKSVGFLDARRSPWYKPNPQFMFWLTSDMYPAFDVYNDGPVSLVPYIRFTGMKYDIVSVKQETLLAALKQAKLPCRRITIGGVETTSTLE